MKKNKQDTPKSTNEASMTHVEGFIKISDPNTGKTIVETRA